MKCLVTLVVCGVSLSRSEMKSVPKFRGNGVTTVLRTFLMPLRANKNRFRTRSPRTPREITVHTIILPTSVVVNLLYMLYSIFVPDVLHTRTLQESRCKPNRNSSVNETFGYLLPNGIFLSSR